MKKCIALKSQVLHFKYHIQILQSWYAIGLDCSLLNVLSYNSKGGTFFLTVKKSKKRPVKCDLSVADPGEGPLFLDQTKGRKVKKNFLTPPPPPYPRRSG